MRMATPILAGLAVVAVLAAPALAKSTKAHKAETETEDSSPSCHSYQLGPDGNWAPLPCQEFGTHSSSQHRAPPKGHSEETR